MMLRPGGNAEALVKEDVNVILLVPVNGRGQRYKVRKLSFGGTRHDNELLFR